MKIFYTLLAGCGLFCCSKDSTQNSSVKNIQQGSPVIVKVMQQHVPIEQEEEAKSPAMAKPARVCNLVALND